MALRGRPETVKIGAGLLYVSAEGTDEPADIGDEFDPADWVALGYTDEGSEFSRSVDTENVEVAEELGSIRTVVTGVTERVEFALAQITAFNLNIALNGGIILEAEGADGGTTVVPPALGEESRITIGWRSFDLQETMIFRRCFNDGDLSLNRRKTDKTIIPVSFAVEVPVEVPAITLGTSDGTESWVHEFATAVRGAL